MIRCVIVDMRSWTGPRGRIDGQMSTEGRIDEIPTKATKATKSRNKSRTIPLQPTCALHASTSNGRRVKTDCQLQNHLMRQMSFEIRSTL